MDYYMIRVKKVYINLFILTGFLFPVNLVVEPYLQDATPNSIHILWETDSYTESILEWGMYAFLSEQTVGSSIVNYGNSRIHTTQLTGLEPSTRYYYRIMYGDEYSDLYNFITPPESSSETSFRIVAMSDMQRDNSNPNKFYEVIHDGVIDIFLMNIAMI